MMFRRSLAIVFATVALTALAGAAIPAQAQVRLLERGPELDRLGFLEGAWKGELTRFLPGGRTLALTPRQTFEWSVGGAWLEGHDTTTLPAGAVIHNFVRITWNAQKQRYVGAWQDNVFPGFVSFEGVWSEDGKLALDTGTFELAGRPHRVTFTYRKASNDRFCIEMQQAWDDQPAAKVAEGCFDRVGTRSAAP